MNVTLKNGNPVYRCNDSLALCNFLSFINSLYEGYLDIPKNQKVAACAIITKEDIRVLKEDTVIEF